RSWRAPTSRCPRSCATWQNPGAAAAAGTEAAAGAAAAAAAAAGAAEARWRRRRAPGGGGELPLRGGVQGARRRGAGPLRGGASGRPRWTALVAGLRGAPGAGPRQCGDDGGAGKGGLGVHGRGHWAL
ncbi:unnamed protein product, partial [Prorocentrum cordatum]